MAKTITTRMQQKHDTLENWNNKPDFIPLEGELIIYDDIKAMKVGDGTTNLANLEFFSAKVWGTF